MPVPAPAAADTQAPRLSLGLVGLSHPESPTRTSAAPIEASHLLLGGVRLLDFGEQQVSVGIGGAQGGGEALRR